MKSLTKENYREIIPHLIESETFLYGAGSTGIRVYDVLSALGVPISGFVDDDPNKHGTFICGKRVISFQELEDKAKENEINVILSSIYGNMLLRKIKAIPVVVYEVFEIYEEKYREELRRTLTLNMDTALWFKKIHKIKQAVYDSLSSEILDVYAEYVQTCIPSYQNVASIATDEDHYFISYIKSAAKAVDPLTILDCGAYTGDMLWQLKSNKIRLHKLYAFEANPLVYKKLLGNILHMGLEKKVIPMNIALWDKSTFLSFYADDNDSAGRVVMGEGERVRAERIDDIVDGKVDFIKMDIEGAELPALRGAQETILHNRPLLAISIYHSLDDVVNIPLYLMNLIPDYYWIVRHHSMIYAETVLYGVPNEKMIS